LDRLARDPYIRRRLELEFEKRGAVVECVPGKYDQTPEGEVRKDLKATFAKWKNAKRVERSQRGKKAIPE
jgi:DNA invertase Pin-like site-specific DNA recombinase